METGVDIFLNLVMDGFDHLFITVTDIDYPNASRKVDIFFSFTIPATTKRLRPTGGVICESSI
jgi:hypothetical protein